MKENNKRKSIKKNKYDNIPIPPALPDNLYTKSRNLYKDINEKKDNYKRKSIKKNQYNNIPIPPALPDNLYTKSRNLYKDINEKKENNKRKSIKKDKYDNIPIPPEIPINLYNQKQRFYITSNDNIQQINKAIYDNINIPESPENNIPEYSPNTMYRYSSQSTSYSGSIDNNTKYRDTLMNSRATSSSENNIQENMILKDNSNMYLSYDKYFENGHNLDQKEYNERLTADMSGSSIDGSHCSHGYIDRLASYNDVAINKIYNNDNVCIQTKRYVDKENISSGTNFLLEKDILLRNSNDSGQIKTLLLNYPTNKVEIGNDGENNYKDKDNKKVNKKTMISTGIVTSERKEDINEKENIK